MAITDGQVITAADLNAMVGAAFTNLATDNALLPQGWVQHFHFPGLVVGTDVTRRRAIFTVPFDCYVEALAVEGNDHTAASTLTCVVTGYVSTSLPTITIPGATGKAADISGDLGPLQNFPIVVSGTVGAGINKLARVLLDNSKFKGVDTAVASSAFRVFLKGSQVQVLVRTTSVAAAGSTHVALALREYLARE